LAADVAPGSVPCTAAHPATAARTTAVATPVTARRPPPASAPKDLARALISARTNFSKITTLSFPGVEAPHPFSRDTA